MQAHQGNKSAVQAKVRVTCFAICPFSQYENFVLLGDSKGNVALLEIDAQSGSSIIGECKRDSLIKFTSYTKIILFYNFIAASTDDDSVKDVAWLKNSQGQLLAVSTEVAETLLIWRVNFEKRHLKVHERWLDIVQDDSNKTKELRCIATLPNVNGLFFYLICNFSWLKINVFFWLKLYLL